MVTTRATGYFRPLLMGVGIIALGLSTALVASVAVSILKPSLLVFAFGGLVLLVPPLLMRNPSTYWLFLLSLTTPFDIYKRVSAWMVEPEILYADYGMPAGGSLSLDIFLTDVVLLALVLPWLARLALKREQFYFPRIAYIFLAYLAWALIGLLIEAPSVYLGMVEWLRQLLYFLCFVYLANSIVARSQFRAIAFGLIAALIVAAASVLANFLLGIGTDVFAFSGLYTDNAAAQPTLTHTLSGTGTQTKRSAGIFPHPALAACFIGVTTQIVLAYLAAARGNLTRIALGALAAFSFAAAYLTYSRAGFVGLMAGSTACFLIARWSRLISRQMFVNGVLIFVTAALVSIPLVYAFIQARPETVSRRWEMIDISVAAYLKTPFFGTGLNNSSAVTIDAVKSLRDKGGGRVTPQPIPVHYVRFLTEVGLIGLVLFWLFFWKVVMVAFSAMRAADTEMKVLLVGMVAGIASVATQNIADDPLGGHAGNVLLWLVSGVIVAAVRHHQAVPQARPAPRLRAAVAS